VSLCRPWVPAWGPPPVYGQQYAADQGKCFDSRGGWKFFFGYLTPRMGWPNCEVIFLAGTYYPQVHPQPVENRPQQFG
jgi:hypothetical protein